MSMTITAHLFEAFLRCPTKCYLRSFGERETENVYADWVRTQNESYRSQGIKRLMEGAAPDEIVVGPPGMENLKTAKWRLAVNLVARAHNLESSIHAVERVPSEGQVQPAQFIPIRFIFTNKLTRGDKLILAFDTLVLSEMLKREVSHGKIIHGTGYFTVKIKTSTLTDKVRKLTGNIAKLIGSESAPDLILNRHCAECEHQSQCRQKAIERDDLSLLANMTERERKKFNSKGIFNITQLSYTFRPRRRPKRLREKREKYHHALKALAIRQKKIHIVGQPQLKIVGTPVYLDVEGLPDLDFYYLIGLRFKLADSVVQRSLWTDDAKGEKGIWIDFLNILAGIETPVLIHYGSFETTFLKRMTKRYGELRGGSGATEAVTSALNLVSILFAQAYFPTYSNRLKDLGAYLGFRWSCTNPSGTQSIIWRMDWEQSGNPSAKQNLITYNSEDCHAVEVLTETLLGICSPDDQPKLKDGTAPEIAFADSLTSRDRLWRHFSSPIVDFEAINKSARWDFQRDRIYIRTNKQLRRTASAKKSIVKKALPINKTIKCEELQVCPFCGSKPDRQFRPRTLVLYDLRFSRFGLRRWVVKYHFHYYRCGSCQKRFGRPEEFWPHSEFGRNVVVFAVYEMIELCVPQMTTTQTLSRLFGLRIANSVVSSFKASAAEYYAETRQRILAHIIKGKLIHADETPIALKDRRGYVWVFASMLEVVYFYADTREGDLLREKLKDFRGVLISDFYSAYDSLPCPQQKCLLHLMHDLNELVLDFPFDEELRRIVLGFGDLLRRILETIDRWGLKRRFLSKHHADVERFYRQIAKTGYQSEAALKCKNRFEKNRRNLFTFLRYDGIPWNNNNAEHAIKAFARFRRLIAGLSSPKGIEDSLTLLSVRQTCKYSGVDFLDFLRSGEKDIEVFAQIKHRQRGTVPS